MKVLITGAAGLLGHAARSQLPDLYLSIVPLTHAELDITNSAEVSRAISDHEPDVVLNCAGYTRVDDAETHEAEAFRINAEAAYVLAECCARSRIRVVYPSTDYVFDGRADTPWTPGQPTHPINAYGRSKAAGENATRANPDHLIVRTSWLFGGGGPNFVRTIATRLREGSELRVVADQTGRPTYARDLARAIGLLLNKNVPAGTYHVANEGATTWYDFAREIARQLGNRADIRACTSADFSRPAPRPRYSVLDTINTDRLIGPLRGWRDAVADAIRTQDY